MPRATRPNRYAPSIPPSGPNSPPASRPISRSASPNPNSRSSDRSPFPRPRSNSPPPRRRPPPRHRPQRRQEPQRTVVDFWDRFNSKHPGKAYTLLPDNFYATRAAGAHAQKAVLHGVHALASYEQAAAECRAKVAKIVAECKRVNQKYRDPHFDIEADLMRALSERQPPDSLMGLTDTVQKLRPMSVKRVEDIFEDPQFFIEGPTANDVRQGKEGDCWFMSALCTLSNKEGLISRVCVARDEKVGVYGFVFHRDGEWISEVIDDKLYLIKEDYDNSALERNNFLQLQNRASPDEEYKAVMQTGSRALYFAQCSDQNETWLPLLEKAYAKAHGDYAALESGFVGEGIEDLTGGVTTEVFSSDILDKDKFWSELMRVNKDFLYGCGQMGGIYGSRKGILEKHAYGIMEACEIEHEGKVHRLLKLRNPWGNTEWKGPWSDGSSEWSPFWMEKLNHKFGDDGLFWISYRDLLRHYQHFDRTRLFGREWTVTQQWTSVQVPWSSDFLDTKFRIKVDKNTPVVIVLSQLDDRYFRGLEGPYEFHLQFRLHRKGEEDYIVRSNGAYYMRRSVSVELTDPELEAGEYTVMLKVTAKRYSLEPSPEQVVQQVCHTRRDKLLSVGLSYDLAHAKGQFRPLEKDRSKSEKRRRREEQKKWIRKMFEKERNARKRAKWRAMKIEEKKLLKEEQRYAQRMAELERIEAERRKEEAAEKAAAMNGMPGESDSHVNGFRPDGYDGPQNGNALGINMNGHADELPLRSAPHTQPLPQRSNSPPHRSSTLPQVSRAVLSDDHRRPSTPPFRGHGRQPSGSPHGRPASTHFSSFGHGMNPRRTHRDSLSVPPVFIRRPSGSDFEQEPGRSATPSVHGRGRGLSVSDVSSDDLSWDSEIDGPEFSSDEEEELGHGRLAPRGGTHRWGKWFGGVNGPGRGPHEGMGPPEEARHEEEEMDEEPWNAVCVVGLRVYSKEANVDIEVVMPGEDVGEEKVRQLDIDHKEADAVNIRRV